jgi:hypothetical protein
MAEPLFCPRVGRDCRPCENVTHIGRLDNAAADARLRTGNQIMTLEQLLKGRSMLRCTCGKELFVEEMKSDDGQALARFIPCKCGSHDPIHLEAGSVAAGGTSSLMFVWGPPKDLSQT